MRVSRDTKVLYEMCAVALVRGRATLDGADEVGFNIDMPIFMVSYVASITKTHPQTLRQYDRLNLIVPQRTEGGARRYSLRDINRLIQTQRLSQNDGINLAGVIQILSLQEENRQLKRQLRHIEQRAESSERNIFAANAQGDIVEVLRSRNARNWRYDIHCERRALPSSKSFSNSDSDSSNSEDKSIVLWRSWRASSERRLLKAVFWDMDGTLIDSEPYWHEAEICLAKNHGGQWSEELAWQYSGGSLEAVAKAMIELGTQLSVEEIGNGMVDYVAKCKEKNVPWVPGVMDVLGDLAKAGIPSILVSNSPRRLVENIVKHAPSGAFVGYICGDDGYATKPSPEPYIAAGKLVGINADGMLSEEEVSREMAHCIAIEDSFAGLASASSSGATTLAQTAFSNLDVSNGPQFAELHGYENINWHTFEDIVAKALCE